MLGAKRHQAIPCLSCGYDLTGLARSSVCPECATPLKFTLEASNLLRSWPAPMLNRLRRGVYMLAVAPTALLWGGIAAIAVGFFMMLFNYEQGLRYAVVCAGIGCLAAAVSFSAGSVLLTMPIGGRHFLPQWVAITLRVCGPLAAVLGGASLIAMSVPLPNEPMTTLLIRALCQSLTLGALAAMIHACEVVESRTEAYARKPRSYTYNWCVLFGLAFLWIGLYWVSPMRGELGGSWGSGWALGALAIQISMLWRVTDSVDAEYLIANYQQTEVDRGDPGA